MDIIFIVAMSENHVIGIHGQLPWRLPNDLKRFKKLTIGQYVLMGRKTFDSIGKALPSRHNLILTRDQDFSADGVEVVHDKETILARDYNQIFVIGGEEIFRLFLPECTLIHLTLVHTHIAGDAFFPHVRGFVLKSREDHESDEHHQYPYSFLKYVKEAPKIGLATNSTH